MKIAKFLFVLISVAGMVMYTYGVPVTPGVMTLLFGGLLFLLFVPNE